MFIVKCEALRRKTHKGPADSQGIGVTRACCSFSQSMVGNCLFDGTASYPVSPFLQKVVLCGLVSLWSVMNVSWGEEQVSETLPESSPDGLYEYVMRTRKGGDMYSYFFELYPVGHRERAVKTEEYGRGAELLWSPDHARFVINWYALSDHTEPMAFSFSDEGAIKPIPLFNKIREKKYDSLEEQFWTTFAYNYDLDACEADHAYVYALAWLDKETLLLGGCAHGFESPRLVVEDSWCQIYSFKRGTMSSNMAEYNEQCKFLPECAVPPHQGLTRSSDQIRQGYGEGNKVYEIIMPKDEGGMIFRGKGRAGVIRSRLCYCKSAGEYVYDYLILNTQEGAVGSCRLLTRKEFAEKNGSEAKGRDLTESFVLAAGWNLSKGTESKTRIYALCSLDENKFLLQGYVLNKEGKQLAWKTLIFDASSGTFSDDLISHNDSKVRIYTGQGRGGEF